MEKIKGFVRKHNYFVFASLSTLVVVGLLALLLNIELKYYQIPITVIFSFYIIKVLYLIFIETRYD